MPDKLKPENLNALLADARAERKRKRILLVTKITSAAACAVVIIGAGIMMHSYKDSIDQSPSVSPVSSTTGIVTTTAPDNDVTVTTVVTTTEPAVTTTQPTATDEVVTTSKPVTTTPVQTTNPTKTEQTVVTQDYSYIYEALSDLSDKNSENNSIEINASQNDDYDDLISSLEKLKSEDTGKEPSDDTDNDAPGGPYDDPPCDSSAPSDSSPDGSSSSGSQPDYSETYQQVEGINEADVIKTDGKFIYYMTDEYIYVIDTAGNVLSKKPVCDYVNDGVYEMYISDSRVICIYSDSRYYASKVLKTYVKIYTVSDKGVLELETSYYQSGIYLSSRLIDNRLYLLSYSYLTDMKRADINKPATYIPSYCVNGKTGYPDAGCVYINDTSTFEGYTFVTSFDITRNNRKISTAAVFGEKPVLYCSSDSIYLLSNYYDENYDENKKVFLDLALSGYDYSSDSKKKCAITRISIKDDSLSVAARTVIDGNASNQFYADQHEEYFRIVTDRDNDNALYVFDMNLKKISSFKNIAANKSISSVSFDGNTAYISITQPSAPLYVIDISDPINPVFTTTSEASSSFSHLRSYAENLLLGFGYDIYEDTVRLSMISVNKNGVQEEIATKTLEETDLTSNINSVAKTDHKYLLISAKKNIIAFPYNCFTKHYTSEYTYKWELTCFYAIYTYDSKNGFELLTEIETEGYRSRAVYIENNIYIFEDNTLYIVNLKNGELISTVKL